MNATGPLRLPRSGPHGQASAEAVLALPILLFLIFALLQLGWVLWLRVQLQQAAQAAARAYTVWEPLDREAALEHARQAARMSLNPPPAGLELDLQVRPGEPKKGDWFSQDQPGVHQLTVRARVQVPGILGREWQLQADTAILGVIAQEDCCGHD